jgi:hypothetical protein
MFYLCYLCLFAYSVVQHMLCCVFVCLLFFCLLFMRILFVGRRYLSLKWFASGRVHAIYNVRPLPYEKNGRSSTCNCRLKQGVEWGVYLSVIIRWLPFDVYLVPIFPVSLYFPLLIDPSVFFGFIQRLVYSLLQCTYIYIYVI